MRKLIAVSALIGLLASCSPATDQNGAESSTAQARAYAVQALAGGAGELGIGPEYETDLVGLLPNITYDYPSGVRFNASDAVVDGAIVDVRKGIGYFVDDKDSVARAVDFDDPTAIWRTIFVSLAVDDIIGTGQGSDPIGDLVTFPLGIDGGDDYDAVRAGLLAQGRTILFLAEDPKSSAGEYRVLRSGAIIATVDKDGTLSLPFVGGEYDDAAMLLRRADTVEELRQAADQPHQLIEVLDPTYNGPTRG